MIIKDNLDIFNIVEFKSEKNLAEVNEKLKDLPKVLDKDTLKKLIDGEYDVSLKEYTDLNSYRTVMSALYGNSSANKAQSYMKNILGKEFDLEKISAKTFMDKMQEKGFSVKDSVGLYNAIQKYSVTTSILGKENSYVSAKI